MVQKKWKERIGGNSGLIIIGAFIVLSIILTADHLFNLPHLLIKISTGRFEWNELILDLVAIFVIGSISISLIRKSELKQREIERGLKDRESSYRELAESITDVFFALDGELRYTYWNKASENLTGISAKDAIGKSLYDLFPMTEETKKAEEGYLEVLRTQKPRSFENRYQTKGKNFCFEICAYPSKDGLSVFVKDITEHKKTEEELKESEKRFRQLAENIDQVFWLTDWNAKRLLYVNPAYERLYGRSCQSAYDNRMSWQDVIHPDDRARVREAFARSADLSQYVEAEYRIVRDDGTVLWVLDRSYPIQDKYGKIYRFASVAEDITERKKAEEALRENEERLKLVLEGAELGYWDQNMKTGEVVRNRRWAEMLGYTLEEIDSHADAWKELIHPDDLPIVNRIVEDHEAGRTPFFRYEHRMRTKSGEWKWILNCGKIIQRDSDGKPVRATGTHTDITERKKAEEGLQEERNKLQAIIDSMEYGLTIQDRDYNIIFQNEALKGLFGNQLGEKCYQAYEFRDEICDGCPVRMAWADGKPHTTERKIVWQSGEIMFWENTASPIRDARGEIVACLEIARNITERKKAEELLRTSEAQLSNAMKIAKLGYWEYDVAKDLFTFDDHFYSIFRTTAEKVGGYTMSSARYAELFVHPDDRPLVGIEIQKALETTDPHFSRQLEHRIIYADGESGYITVRFFIVKDDKGHTVKTYGANQDITEHKQAEEEIRTERDKLENVTKNIGVGLAIISKDYQTVWANDVLKQIFGEVEGKLCYNTYNGRPDICPGCGVREVFEQGKDVSVHEQVGKDKDGNTIWSQIIATPLKDKEGNITAAMEVVVPITERKKIEEELRASESKYKTLLENLPQKIFFKDRNLVYVSCNENYARDLKIKPNMITGKTDYDFYPESLAEKYRADDKRIMQIGKTEDLEEEYLQEEQKVFVHTFKTPVKDEEGNIIGVLGIFWDITERKKAEEALKESEERYRNFFENAALGIYRTTPDGRILLANPALVQMLGYSSFEELASRNLEEEGFEPQYSRNKFKESLEKTSEVRGLESAWLRRDGSTIFVHENARAVRKEDGSILYYEGMAEDITERKKAEEALRTSEEKYRAIVENATDQIFTLDRQCRFLAINKKAAEMSRKSPDEMVGKSLLDVLPQETAAQFSKNIEEVFETSQSKSIEEGMNLGGKEFYSSSTLNPIKDDKGNVIAVTGIVRDITGRKKAEEAIRASLDRYRSYIEATGQLGWTTSADGEVVEDIPSWRAYTGLSYEEIKGWGWSNALHPDDLEHTTQIWKKAVAARTLYEVEYRLRRHDGVYRHFMARGLPVLDEDGSIREWVGTCIDITERKKAGETLRESEQRYRGVVDNIGIGVALISPNMEILFLNNQMKKWFPNADISKEAICYRAFNSPPREEACSYCPTNKTLQDGQIHESITDTPAGEKVINYRVVSSPIKDLQGNIIAAIEMVEDITEKKRLQEQLIQTEKLAAVGTLAYGIAHEFNNILAGMMANAELGLISKEPEQIKECFEIIVDNSHRASSITNNLLVFAREKEARKELIDITEPLKSVLAITHRELEKNNIEIIEKFKPVPKIYCDPGQFSEVFLNMITNARDAMHPKGGTLTIQVESAEDYIRIVFKDTGCGIPEEIKGRIFEPFVTTKGALGKSEIPGTGLGLFLTYGIINGYKGKIEVETKVGNGTKFSIIIPISENQPPELLLDTRIESSKETEKKLKILLVDDEKAITLGLKKFLESKGHKVSTSLRAKEGLEIFRKGRFDLVLSDITIPDMDGIELIKKVKEKDPQAKIIVITGHIQKEKEEKARQAGADEVLIKPFKNELLQQTISKVVDWR